MFLGFAFSEFHENTSQIDISEYIQEGWSLATFRRKRRLRPLLKQRKPCTHSCWIMFDNIDLEKVACGCYNNKQIHAFIYMSGLIKSSNSWCVNLLIRQLINSVIDSLINLFIFFLLTPVYGWSSLKWDHPHGGSTRKWMYLKSSKLLNVFPS